MQFSGVTALKCSSRDLQFLFGIACGHIARHSDAKGILECVFHDAINRDFDGRRGCVTVGFSGSRRPSGRRFRAAEIANLANQFESSGRSQLAGEFDTDFAVLNLSLFDKRDRSPSSLTSENSTSRCLVAGFDDGCGCQCSVDSSGS